MDSVTEDTARGTTVYTISEHASDRLSENLPLKHDIAFLPAGSDLRKADDKIVNSLTEIASIDTIPRAQALAKITIEELIRQLQSVNAKPLRGVIPYS